MHRVDHRAGDVGGARPRQLRRVLEDRQQLLPQVAAFFVGERAAQRLGEGAREAVLDDALRGGLGAALAGLEPGRQQLDGAAEQSRARLAAAVGALEDAHERAHGARIVGSHLSLLL